MRVLANRGANYLFDTAVVTEVDDLRALRLQDPAHDVDGRIVAVKEARGCDESDRGRPHADTHERIIPWTSNYLTSYQCAERQ
jgi:hypothetical protein